MAPHLLMLNLQVVGRLWLQPLRELHTHKFHSPTCLAGTTQPTWRATPRATRDPAQWRSATTQRSRRACWARPAAMAGPRRVAAGVGYGFGCPGVAAELSSAAASGAAWAKHVGIHSLAMPAVAALSSYRRAAAARARCRCRFARHAPSPPRR